MSDPSDDRKKIWNLIERARSALLVTVGADGELDSRPMGCLQTEFDDTLWFLTFRHSLKTEEIGRDDRVLISYSNSPDYEYVSLSGRAKVVEDRDRIKKLWFEGLRVWFANGPTDPELAILKIDVDEARYWTNAASTTRYAWAYVRAALTHKGPSPGEIGDTKTVRL